MLDGVNIYCARRGFKAKKNLYKKCKMSCSEDETNAASVLSQMSQTVQPTSSENVIAQHIDNSVIAHQCDVETTSSQEIATIGSTIGADEALPTTPMIGLCDATAGDNEPKLGTSLAVSSSVKVYPCEYCGKVFNKSYNLKTHHRVHSGERPYQCTVCGHGFANLGDLKRHDRTHTGEKPYTCEHCSKSFSDFGSHKRHLRLHTGYKPFKCDKCEREFTRLDSYKNHIRLHTGVRPYKCEECQKEFNYLTTYKRHQNVHSGERPYSCDICGKKFTRLIYVRNHKLNNCGKPRGRKSQEKLNEEIGTEDGSNTTTVVAISDDELQNEIKIADTSMIENIAHDLSMESGVQLNVTKVIYSNGGTQPVLIESGEATHHHTLILTATPDGGQQLIEFAADVSDKAESNVTHDETSAGTIFLAQPLPRQTLASDSHEDAKFDAIVTLKHEEQERCSELGAEEANTGEVNQMDGKSTEITAEDRDGSNSDPSAMYIAIDPNQEIIGELRPVADSES